MARHGRDLGELLEHLDLRDAVLVGASMGGNTLWAYVDQFGPSRLAGAVVVDQTPKMLNDAAWPHGFYGYDTTNAATFFDHGVPPARRRPHRGQVRPRPWPGWPSASAGSAAFRDSAAPETLGLLRDHALQDWRDVVRRFPLPLLMLAGRESQVWSCEHAAAAVAGTAHGRALVVEDAGHAISIDQPDLFNELLLDFVAELGAARPMEARRPRRSTAPARGRSRSSTGSAPTAPCGAVSPSGIVAARRHRHHGGPPRARGERPVRRLRRRRPSRTTSSRRCRPGSTWSSGTRSAARCSSAPSAGCAPPTRSTSTPGSGSRLPTEGLAGRLFWAPPR